MEQGRLFGSIVPVITFGNQELMTQGSKHDMIEFLVAETLTLARVCYPRKRTGVLAHENLGRSNLFPDRHTRSQDDTQETFHLLRKGVPAPKKLFYIFMGQIKETECLFGPKFTQVAIVLGDMGPFSQVKEPRVSKQNLTGQIFKTFVKKLTGWKDRLAKSRHSY
jgi:hypothetical protein